MSSKKGANRQIRVGIVGYGNVGKGVESAIKQNQDMVLVCIFTRRNPRCLKNSSNAKIIHISKVENYLDNINVAVLCGGSATDLPDQGPRFSSMFNTVDSYDTHAKMTEYFDKVNQAAKKADKTSIIATGWDPGLFSLLRAFSESVLPIGASYTFWGPGVSQGHSNAIRGIQGVKNAIQYTIPIKDALQKVRSGENPILTNREMHRRVCYVVPDDHVDPETIRQKIVTMPNYFAPYHTDVNFISEDELSRKHSEMPHGGFVLRSGKTGKNHKHLIEFSVKLDSNPEFTGNIMVAYARAAYRLNQEGHYGAKTVFDVPPSYLFRKSYSKLLKDVL